MQAIQTIQDGRSMTQRALMRSSVLSASLWLLLLPVGVLVAAESARVEKTIDTTANPRITLSNVTGQVTVKGWSRTQVHAFCVTSSSHIEVDALKLPEGARRAEKVHFATHILDPQAVGKDQGADYDMEIPFGSSLVITNRQGSVAIENLQGEATVECVGSTILVRDVGGHLSVRSVGGNIEVIRPSGRVEASSITGDLHFVSPTGSQLRGVTTSGKILYEGDLVSGGDYALSSYSGDIDMLCPASASFELDAKTVRGKVENALSLTPNRHFESPAAIGETLFGTHNTGNATVEVKSFSGTIRIRPQP